MEWHPDARIEYLETLAWYAEKDPKVGDRLRRIIDAAEKAIKAMPHRFPLHSHGTQQSVLRDFPYSIIFFGQSGRLWIVALAHHRQKPGYWKRRLKTKR